MYELYFFQPLHARKLHKVYKSYFSFSFRYKCRFITLTVNNFIQQSGGWLAWYFLQIEKRNIRYQRYSINSLLWHSYAFHAVFAVSYFETRSWEVKTENHAKMSAVERSEANWTQFFPPVECTECPLRLKIRISFKKLMESEKYSWKTCSLSRSRANVA